MSRWSRQFSEHTLCTAHSGLESAWSSSGDHQINLNTISDGSSESAQQHENSKDESQADGADSEGSDDPGGPGDSLDGGEVGANLLSVHRGHWAAHSSGGSTCSASRSQCQGLGLAKL